jgi:hypothetical protein
MNDKIYKWIIEPHPYDSYFDAFVTNSNAEALKSILHLGENYLWDTHNGEDSAWNGKTRTIKVTHNAEVPEEIEVPT